MTDPYADTDIWPNPPASQQPARPATLAASEPSRVVGEGSDAQEAREASYAEAIRRYRRCEPVSCQLCDDRLTRRADAAERARDAALAEVAGLRDRLGRVEALHRPYQLFESCPKTWGCEHERCTEDAHNGEWYHSDQPAGQACTECFTEYDGEPADWPCDTAAALAPVTGDTENASPAAEDTPSECLGIRVAGPMSATLCDDDGWVRSGMWHWGTDYKCTGSVHPPLGSPIWPGREIRCANPIHDVQLPIASPGVTITPTTGAASPTEQATEGGAK